MFFSTSPVDMFTIVPIFIMIISIVVIALVIFSLIKGFGQWRYNNSQPVLTVPAKVTSKRTNVSSSIHNSSGDTGLHHGTTHTTYFVSFEVESGDRIEFMVDGREYGALTDNDIGKLTFQGTRFLGFKRNIS